MLSYSSTLSTKLGKKFAGILPFSNSGTSCPLTVLASVAYGTVITYAVPSDGVKTIVLFSVSAVKV